MFGTYSGSGWDIYALQITEKIIRTRTWHGYANHWPGKPGHLTLKQIRSRCIGESREMAENSGAHFGGVRHLVFPPRAGALAKKNNVSERGMRDILERAKTTLGGIDRAVKWLESPCPQLNHQLPMELVRTQRGRWRLENLLTRLQFKQLIKKGNRDLRKLISNK
jgi:hypothetical protein